MKGFIGAWLNHIINVKKNANHVMCSVLIGGLEKFSKFNFESDIIDLLVELLIMVNNFNFNISQYRANPIIFE